MNNIEKHVVAKDGEKVIGYVLAMTEESKFDIPMLLPMFDFFSEWIKKLLTIIL